MGIFKKYHYDIMGLGNLICFNLLQLFLAQIGPFWPSYFDAQIDLLLASVKL